MCMMKINTNTVNSCVDVIIQNVNEELFELLADINEEYIDSLSIHREYGEGVVVTGWNASSIVNELLDGSVEQTLTDEDLDALVSDVYEGVMEAVTNVGSIYDSFSRQGVTFSCNIFGGESADDQVSFTVRILYKSGMLDMYGLSSEVVLYTAAVILTLIRSLGADIRGKWLCILSRVASYNFSRFCYLDDEIEPSGFSAVSLWRKVVKHNAISFDDGLLSLEE